MYVSTNTSKFVLIPSTVDGFHVALCVPLTTFSVNTAEYTECSRHGTCVRETGRCECSFGFGGEACDDISDSDDAQVRS